MVERVGDVDIARAVHGQTLRHVELRLCGWTTITGIPCRASACEGAYQPVLRDLANSVSLGDVNFTGRSDRECKGTHQRRGGRQTSLVGKRSCSRAGYGYDAGTDRRRWRQQCICERESTQEDCNYADAGCDGDATRETRPTSARRSLRRRQHAGCRTALAG